jgi:hypothetical protein
MNTTTIQGNRRTTPRGTEMLELPFKRKGRRKNASLDASLLFGRDSSFKERVGDEGRRFSARRTRSIDAKPGLSTGEIMRIEAKKGWSYALLTGGSVSLWSRVLQ